MTERPIAFSPAMVSAILDRRKLTTRRILKVDPETGEIKPPTIRAGDLLWVKETHYRFGWWEPEHIGAARHWRFEGPDECSFDPPAAEHRRGPPSGDEAKQRPQWYSRPAQFMPRRFCRLTLRVTRVYGDHLQNLSWVDAEEEGIAGISKDGRIRKFGIPDRDGLPGEDNEGWHWPRWKKTPQEAFAALWDSLHGPGAWAQNPWVAVIAFEPETRP